MMRWRMISSAIILPKWSQSDRLIGCGYFQKLDPKYEMTEIYFIHNTPRINCDQKKNSTAKRRHQDEGLKLKKI